MVNVSSVLPHFPPSPSPLPPLSAAGGQARSGGESGSEDPDPAGRGGSEAGEGDGDGLRGGDPPAGGRDRRAEDSESGSTASNQ